jgi:predicted ABC-type ATPase
VTPRLRRLKAKAEALRQFHEWLKRHYAVRKNPTSGKTVIFMAGLPAAGKSSYVREHYSKYVKCCIVDPDAIAAKHPLFDPKNPEPAHKATTHVVDEQFDRFLATGQSFILDTTAGRYDKLYSRIVRAKAAGFRVKLVYIIVPLSVSLERNRNRYRSVPDRVVIEKADDIGETFLKIRPFVDEVVVVDNSKPSARLARHAGVVA